MLMQIFGNLSIRTKVLFIMGSFAFFTLGISFAGVLSFRETDALTTISNHLYQLDSYISRSQTSIEDLYEASRLENIDEVIYEIQNAFEDIDAVLSKIENTQVDYDAVIFDSLTNEIDAFKTTIFDEIEIREQQLIETTDLSTMSMQEFEENVSASVDKILSSTNEMQNNVIRIGEKHDKETQTMMLTSSFGLVGWIILVFLLFTRYYKHRFGKIINNTLAIAEGDLSKSIDDTASDELGKISQSINKMKQNLLATYSENKTIISSLPEPIFSLDKNGVIQSVNPATEALLGYKQSELVGKSIQEIIADTDITPPVDGGNDAE